MLSVSVQLAVVGVVRKEVLIPRNVKSSEEGCWPPDHKASMQMPSVLEEMAH